MEKPEVVENFFGVYLLYCTNPKYKGRTYIGYTVDPNRRIKQHNAGKKFGGAWRTSNKGPWEMVMIIHGFPNDISALRFEWAWQHPEVSRRLKHVPKKKPRQKVFDYCLTVLSAMLRVGPWSRLPLTIRWLAPEFAREFVGDNCPPVHMPLVYGKVVSRKVDKKDVTDKRPETDEEKRISFCTVCENLVRSEDKLTCISPNCLLIGHMICLAKIFNKNDGRILPVEGCCPLCGTNVLWGDLIRLKKGCYRDLVEKGSESDSSDFYD